MAKWLKLKETAEHLKMVHSLATHLLEGGL
jgi:hypothetical protein